MRRRTLALARAFACAFVLAAIAPPRSSAARVEVTDCDGVPSDEVQRLLVLEWPASRDAEGDVRVSCHAERAAIRIRLHDARPLRRMVRLDGALNARPRLLALSIAELATGAHAPRSTMVTMKHVLATGLLAPLALGRAWAGPPGPGPRPPPPASARRPSTSPPSRRAHPPRSQPPAPTLAPALRTNDALAANAKLQEVTLAQITLMQRLIDNVAPTTRSAPTCSSAWAASSTSGAAPTASRRARWTSRSSRPRSAATPGRPSASARGRRTWRCASRRRCSRR